MAVHLASLQAVGKDGEEVRDGGCNGIPFSLVIETLEAAICFPLPRPPTPPAAMGRQEGRDKRCEGKETG